MSFQGFPEHVQNEYQKSAEQLTQYCSPKHSQIEIKLRVFLRFGRSLPRPGPTGLADGSQGKKGAPWHQNQLKNASPSETFLVTFGAFWIQFGINISYCSVLKLCVKSYAKWSQHGGKMEVKIGPRSANWPCHSKGSPNTFKINIRNILNNSPSIAPQLLPKALSN